MIACCIPNENKPSKSGINDDDIPLPEVTEHFLFYILTNQLLNDFQ